MYPSRFKFYSKKNCEFRKIYIISLVFILYNIDIIQSIMYHRTTQVVNNNN